MERGWRSLRAKCPVVPQRDIADSEVTLAVVDNLALITSFLFPIRAVPDGAGEMERELCNSVGLFPMSAFCLCVLVQLACW